MSANLSPEDLDALHAVIPATGRRVALAEGASG